VAPPRELDAAGLPGSSAAGSSSPAPRNAPEVAP
jgi:hypothetical protein